MLSLFLRLFSVRKDALKESSYTVAFKSAYIKREIFAWDLTNNYCDER